MEKENKFFYANGLEIAVSPFDFNLKFLRQGTSTDAKPGEILPPARLDELIVSTSPAHAKAMLASLFKTVLDYEKNIGPIALNIEAATEFDTTFGALLK